MPKPVVMLTDAAAREHVVAGGKGAALALSFSMRRWSLASMVYLPF